MYVATYIFIFIVMYIHTYIQLVAVFKRTHACKLCIIYFPNNIIYSYTNKVYLIAAYSIVPVLTRRNTAWYRSRGD